MYKLTSSPGTASRTKTQIEFFYFVHMCDLSMSYIHWFLCSLYVMTFHWFIWCDLICLLSFVVFSFVFFLCVLVLFLCFYNLLLLFSLLFCFKNCAWTFVIICCITLAYSMGQIINSVYLCHSVCLSVRTLTVAFLDRCWQKWQRGNNPQQ